MTIQEFARDHVAALSELFSRLPDSDLTFVKEDVTPAAVAGWPTAPGWRWVDVAPDGTVKGLAALLPLTGWSNHVAELRLVVDPLTRRRGIGRRLAQRAAAPGVPAGLRAR